MLLKSDFLKNGLKMRSRRGFIFSLDALLAILSVTIIISASVFFLSQVQSLSWSQPNLYVVSMDTMSVLRQDNSLREAVESGSNATLVKFLDNMYPENLCGSMQLLDSSSSTVMYANKTSCPAVPGETSSKEVFVTRRTFIASGSMHFAYLRTWYR